MGKVMILAAVAVLLSGCPNTCGTETALLKQENSYLKKENAEKTARIRELESLLLTTKQKNNEDGFGLSDLKKLIE